MFSLLRQWYRLWISHGQRIVGGALGIVLKESGAEEENTQKQMIHEAALAHTDELVQYWEEQHDSYFVKKKKRNVKKLVSEIKKRCDNTKKNKNSWPKMFRAN